MGFTCITIRAIIQKSEICFCGSPIFCCVAGLDVRTFGPKPNALSRKGSRKNRTASFVGKGGTSRPVKPRGTQRRTLRLCSDAGTKRSWVLPSPQPYKKELTCVSSFLFSCNVRGGAGHLPCAAASVSPERSTTIVCRKADLLPQKEDERRHEDAQRHEEIGIKDLGR